MTTGRINQVTIVAPLVRQPTAPFGGEEIFSYWVGGRLAPAGLAARVAWAVPRSWTHPLTPSEFPRALSTSGPAPRTREASTLPRRPKRRPFRRVQHSGSPLRRVPPVAHGYRRGEPPGAHKALHSALDGGAPQRLVMPPRAASAAVRLMPRAAEPRQTVGNRASRAAYELEQNQPSGRPGGVPRSPGQPPRTIARCVKFQRPALHFAAVFQGSQVLSGFCFSGVLPLVGPPGSGLWRARARARMCGCRTPSANFCTREILKIDSLRPAPPPISHGFGGLGRGGLAPTPSTAHAAH